MVQNFGGVSKSMALSRLALIKAKRAGNNYSEEELTLKTEVQKFITALDTIVRNSFEIAQGLRIKSAPQLEPKLGNKERAYHESTFHVRKNNKMELPNDRTRSQSELPKFTQKPQPNDTYTWQYRLSDGTWTNYDETSQKAIEEAYGLRRPQVVLSHDWAARDTYTITFGGIATVTQRNNFSGTVKSVRRIGPDGSPTTLEGPRQLPDYVQKPQVNTTTTNRIQAFDYSQLDTLLDDYSPSEPTPPPPAPLPTDPVLPFDPLAEATKFRSGQSTHYTRSSTMPRQQQVFARASEVKPNKIDVVESSKDSTKRKNPRNTKIHTSKTSGSPSSSATEGSSAPSSPPSSPAVVHSVPTTPVSVHSSPPQTQVPTSPRMNPSKVHGAAGFGSDGTFTFQRSSRKVPLPYLAQKRHNPQEQNDQEPIDLITKLNNLERSVDGSIARIQKELEGEEAKKQEIRSRLEEIERFLKEVEVNK